jgi:hypothetical protein
MNGAGRFLGFALALATLMVFAVPSRPALAGDRPTVVAQNEPGGFLRRLLGLPPQPQRYYAPPPAAYPPPPQAYPAQPAPPTKKRQVRAPAPQVPHEVDTVQAVEKADDAKRAMVVGDFMARSLAKGLAKAYADDANVVVVDAANGSSGLVRSDFYDWPAKIPGLVADQKPDAILVMLGANDRQALGTDQGTQQPGSDAWRAAYAARVAALCDVLKTTGKPILWVGLVPVESSSMSRDYSSFNGIIREQAEAKGIDFIDVWNGFADDEGKYVAVGPDVRGQSVQLRGSDGLNFTLAGQNKLAYFVQHPLDDIFGGNSPQLASVDATGAAVKPSVDAPQIGPMISLDALSSAGGETLSSDAGAPKSGNVTEAIAAALTGKEAGDAPRPQTPPAGRIDSYVWPPHPPEGPYSR